MEWMPIESAPRDGSRFLAYDWKGVLQFFQWQDFGNARPNAPVGWRDGFITVYAESSPRAPKFWMPLPPPPTGGE